MIVTWKLNDSQRAALLDEVNNRVPVEFIEGLDEKGRREALLRAEVILCRDSSKEIREHELPHLKGVKLIQYILGGVDFVPLDKLPPDVPLATNGGAHAASMSEHTIAMAFAGAKRLRGEHIELEKGVFNQQKSTVMLRGGVCGIFGYGGTGAAVARGMRAFGMKIHAINRSPITDTTPDWTGGPAQLDELLRASDIFVISASLTSSTLGLIGRRELALMKKNAVLVNVARGELVDEAALYQHLVDNPGFTAGIDAWWIEPARHGRFEMKYPFLGLPNVIGSPHNSAAAGEGRANAVRFAVKNCMRAFNDEAVHNIIKPEDRRWHLP